MHGHIYIGICTCMLCTHEIKGCSFGLERQQMTLLSWVLTKKKTSRSLAQEDYYLLHGSWLTCMSHKASMV